MPDPRLNRKRKTKDPCVGCGLHKNLCICALTPSLNLKTRVALIVHAKELKRTTNTGRLALRALTNSTLIVRGEGRERLDLQPLLDPRYRSLLFFPGPQARELNSELLSESELPVQLIVPEGNWRQASKVQSRHPELKDLPRVMISAANPSMRHLRAESTQEGMATLQAIAHALRIIEGEEVFASLDVYYRAKLEATLRGRGQA